MLLQTQLQISYSLPKHLIFTPHRLQFASVVSRLFIPRHCWQLGKRIAVGEMLSGLLH